MDEKNKKDELEIIFQKFKLITKIDEGSFGSIYLAKNIKINQKVAIKLEDRKNYKHLLEREAYILFYLRGKGLPEIITFGKTQHYYILVQTLLGPSLAALMDNYNIIFTIKDICMLSIQMIERLEYIHSKDYIHRDIKPHNFLMGLKDPNILYIIDFGFSKKFRSKKRNHIKFSITNNFIGTPRYCSINGLRGAEQSRRDDLESLFYVILYFFKGSLPWQNLRIKSRNERFFKINEMKKKADYKNLCKNLPKEFYDFGNYIKHLKFEEDPNYNYMKDLFYSILSKLKLENDGRFSWIKSNKLTDTNFHFYTIKSSRKPSVHKRLYQKISNSLEKKSYMRKRKNILQNLANSTKDNITLFSINTDNNLLTNGNINYSNNNIKNLCSSEGVKEVNIFKNDSVPKNNNNYNKNLKVFNFDKINTIKLNNNYSHKNQKIIHKCPTNLKIKRIDNYNKLYEDDSKNVDYNEKNKYFNYHTIDNESNRNLFIRNKKLYTSPNLVLDIKRSDNSVKNEILKISNNNNTINNIQKDIKKNYYKKLDMKNSNLKNNILQKNNYIKYKNLNNYFCQKFKYSKSTFNLKNFCKNNIINYNSNDCSIINNNIINNSINNNIRYYNYINSKTNINSKKNNIMLSYNEKNINYDKIVKINKCKTIKDMTVNNMDKSNRDINNDFFKTLKIENKFNSLNNIDINLNFGLINNNYKTNPLNIYKIHENRINPLIYSKNINIKNINKISDNNSINNNSEIFNQYYENRVEKYKIKRNPKINIINNFPQTIDFNVSYNKLRNIYTPKNKIQLVKKNCQTYKFS